MVIELLDKDTERKAIDTVKEAVDAWAAGNIGTPSDAIIKAAEGKDFTPEMLSRVVESFNSAAQLAHFETADHDKRADTIPLADATDVVSHFFPEKVETKQEKAASVRVADGYGQPELADYMTIRSEKQASETMAPLKLPPRHYPRDRASMLKTAQRDFAIARRRAEGLRTEARAHYDNVIKASAALAEHFRTPGHIPFDVVESRARARWGVKVATLLDAVYHEGKLAQLHEKRANVTGKEVVFVNEREFPYSLIKGALAEGEAFAEKMYEIVDVVDEATKKMAAAMPAINKEAQDPLESFEQTFGIQSAPSEAPAPILTAMSDPAHEARLAAIGQYYALNDLMTNDPVISAVEPQAVLDAFNKLSDVAPMVARDPVMLRGILRRYVQQPDIDPFEMKSLVDLDSAVRSREAPEGEKSRAYVI